MRHPASWLCAYRIDIDLPKCIVLACSIFGLHLAQAQTGSGGKNGSIEKCERNLGTLAVAEPQTQMLARLNEYKLGSPATMLRMIAQESGCFTVVERGVAMQNIQQERALAAGGLLQQDANVGGGQLQAADFVLTPSLQFSDNTGGVGGAIGGLFGRMGGVMGHLGGLAGGLSFKEAETTLLLADVRSGIQVASAEGQATKMDFSLGGWGWGGFGWASAGGYSKTPEGKLLAASLLDNFNRIVQQVKDKPILIQSTSASSQKNAQASKTATYLPPPQAAAALGAPVVAVLPPAGIAGLPSQDLLVRANGSYFGRLDGHKSGDLIFRLMPDGQMNGVLNSDHSPQFVLSGRLTNAQGDFVLSGHTRADNIMLSGRIDLSQLLVQGQWFMSKINSSTPHASGGFVARR